MKTRFVAQLSRASVVRPVVWLLTLAIAALPFAGCRNPASPEPEYDILLAGESEQDVARLLAGGYERITLLTQNPGEELRIGLPTEGGAVEVVVLSFTKDSDNDLRPVLTRSDGQRAYLRLGLDGLTPVVKFTDRDGNPLTIGGQQLSFIVDQSAMNKIMSQTTALGPGDWLAIGIAAVAVGIVVWVGAGVVRLAAVGIGYLAVAAIVVGGVVIGVSAFNRLLEILGWEPADLIALFKTAFEDTVRILADAVEQFRQTYNI